MVEQVNGFASAINPTSSRFQEFCSINPVHSLHNPISQHNLTCIDQPASDNHIPAGEPSNDNAETRMVNMKCCCGRPDCAYLEHNNAALGSLEHDLETAARLGQALLDRHEAYVKESQAEQAHLSSYVADLENDKTSLQDANHRMVVENRELLKKLEQLNTDFGDSGKRVHELEDLLQDCEQEIRRLNAVTHKTMELETKMLDMEREHAELNKHLEDGKNETRSTISRWRESERRLRGLEQEVQKIEWAARIDREKHEDFATRMEKDRALERELCLSEGRLKATAAVQNMQKGGPQKQVVSNFVRDILQDNANLQAGIAELRELLQSSNDEVQNLREQVMLHQPIQDDDLPVPQRSSSLSDELAFSQSSPKSVQQEVHVHHHYHTKLGSKKERTPVRKASRRRALMPSAALSLSPSSSGASTPLVGPQRYVSSPSPLTIQPANSKVDRWSIQSTATASTYMSSIASSPRSYLDRHSSIFDHMEREEESSRPTSPDSFTMTSPMPFKMRGRSKDETLGTFPEEDGDVDEPIEPLESAMLEDTIPVEVTLIATPLPEDEEQITVVPDMDLTPKPSMALKRQAHQDYTPQISHPSDPHIPEPPPPPDTLPVRTAEEPEPLPQVDPNKGEHELREPPDNAIGHQKRSRSRSPPPEPRYVPDFRHSIRRSNSHESLLSISGMDIHLAQHTYPSNSALRLLGGSTANKHYFAPTPVPLRQTPTATTQPLASVTEYTATSRPGLDHTPSASMLALSGIRSHTARGNLASGQAQSKGLMGSVGGWVSSKWGKAPASMKPVTDSRSATPPSMSPRPSISTAQFASSQAMFKHSEASIAPSTASKSSVSSGKRSVSANALDVPTIDKTSIPQLSGSLIAPGMMGRKPGINQSGPIPGFAAAIAQKKVPVSIDPVRIDVGGLKEGLIE